MVVLGWFGGEEFCHGDFGEATAVEVLPFVVEFSRDRGGESAEGGRLVLDDRSDRACFQVAPVHRDVPGTLAWWRSKARPSLFSSSTSSPGDWSADEDALRLSAFFDACHDDSGHAEKLRDAVMDQFPPDVEEGLFAATARKVDRSPPWPTRWVPRRRCGCRAGSGTSFPMPGKSALNGPRQRRPSP
ncbi:hypothetical protein [Streptomyces sp. NPDC060027]|uniref:hypothetical protein n=1 Tax=Streptomyces sp. NPDC060027 TaxID=3347040 RepID=UPI003695156A